MLLSMTGYGAGQATNDGLHAVVEIRTVNNRYLKLHSRLPDGYASLESRIEEVVRKQIRRGAVQLNVEVVRASMADDFCINQDVLFAYATQVAKVRQALGETECKQSDVEIGSLLALPGVINDDSRRGHAEEEWPTVHTALKMALAELCQMRRTEGSAMAKDLEDQLQDIVARAAEIDALAPRVVQAYQTRLTERLNKLLLEHDVQVQPTDVVREVGLFAERADISEEIVRLRSHLDQFSQILGQDDGGAGRKLDFLVQELLRETNTIGSKANDSEIAKRVVHIKACIERIREMVQNVE